ncbi:MAG: hypothetical protein R3C04_03120 [Hyphomonas sp.]
MADGEVGTVTSAGGGAGLALVRTDRLQKALAEGHPLSCNGAPVTLDLPDWAEAELKALAEAGADD